jgi:hypothetical protein
VHTSAFEASARCTDDVAGAFGGECSIIPCRERAF